jgi:hypothetical protein
MLKILLFNIPIQLRSGKVLTRDDYELLETNI